MIAESGRCSCQTLDIKQKEGGGGKNSATELMNDLVAQLTIEDIQTELQYAQPTNFKVVL